MNKLTILEFPDPRLRTRATPVEGVDDDLRAGFPSLTEERTFDLTADWQRVPMRDSIRDRLRRAGQGEVPATMWAEVLSPDNQPDHWDVIEGQGSLFHPGYSGVTLGLLHGSQPDALILCHDASRREILDVAGHYPIPPLEVFIDRLLAAARVTNSRCEFAGISVNTTSLNDPDRSEYLANLEQQHDLPAVDPAATGMRRIADYLLRDGGPS